MRDLVSKKVRYLAERSFLIDQLLQIESMPKTNKRTVAKMKWLADLRAHQHEFSGFSEAETVAAAAQVTAREQRSFSASYRHVSAEVNSMFNATSYVDNPDALRNILGLSDEDDPDDLSCWVKGMHPDDAERVLKAQVESRDKFLPFDQTWRTWHATDECYVWVRAISKAVWDESNPLAPAYFEGVVMDWSAHHEANMEVVKDAQKKVKGALMQMFQPRESDVG